MELDLSGRVGYIPSTAITMRGKAQSILDNWFAVAIHINALSNRFLLI